MCPPRHTLEVKEQDAVISLAQSRAPRATPDQEAHSALLVEAIRRESPREGDDHRHRLVALWAEDVLQWCQWLCNRRQDPEDLAQDVLLVVFRDAHRVRDPAAFRCWAYGVAWRTVRWDRKRAWFRLRAPLEPAEEAAWPVLDERARAVRKVLDGLGVDERAVLWLHYVEGRTRVETATALGMPEGTLARRLTRARAAFAARATELGLGPRGVGT